MTTCLPTSSIVTRRRSAERMRRRREQDDVVAAEEDGLDAAIRGQEREDAEVDAAIEDGAGDLARRHAPDLDRHLRMQRGEALDVRQQAVHGRLVGAHDHAAAAHLLELLDGGLGLAGQPQQPLRVILEQTAGLGERAVPGRPVEQPLAQLILDPADRLADGRLGPVEAARRGGETPVRGDGEKRGQVRELHKLNLS